MKYNIPIALLLLLVVTVKVTGQSSSIIGSKHDLSINGSGPVKSSTGEQRVCIFCHTPHNSKPEAPLWNRTLSGQVYVLYDASVSNTLDATPGQPDGSSILCLSCHDGTIALGSIVSSPDDIFGGNSAMPSTEPGYLGTDLSNDHPVSFVYSTATSDPLIKASPQLPTSLDVNDKVQCASCHNSHNNIHGKFLVESNENSALCFRCHDRTDWDLSAHNVSTATWNGSGTSPWAHIGPPPPAPHIDSPPYATVAQNACSNCHDTHSAGGKKQLLKASGEENNCLDCHNANVATQDIASQFAKPYAHNVSAYLGVHDPSEATLVATTHVECQDCHDPHKVIEGQPLLGAKGIQSDGVSTADPILHEYELCNRCHTVNSLPYILRQFGDNNVMNDFNPTNISHHAVVAPGNNPSPRGLIAPLTAASQILCTDCHASDGAGAPSGPHGSIYPRILKANYNLNATTGLANHTDATLTTEFALCAQCHNMTTVNTIHSGMKGGHFLAYTTCNTCHDPHGYSGGTAANNSFLLNLIADDVNYLGPQRIQGTWYDPFIELDQGSGGSCTFNCHARGHGHSGSSYSK